MLSARPAPMTPGASKLPSAPYNRPNIASTSLTQGGGSSGGGSGGEALTPQPHAASTPNKRRSEAGADAERVRVVVRLRPALGDEDSADALTHDGDNTLTLYRPDAPVTHSEFVFDKVLSPSATQHDVFNAGVKDVVDDVLNGYNGTVMAYGQTGTGKTYTLGNTQPAAIGMIPRAVAEIFQRAHEDPLYNYEVSMSYIQIYMELIQDLLRPESENLQIREDSVNQGGVYLAGVHNPAVSSLQECLHYLELGERNRTVAFTDLNAHSSRSHAVVMVTVVRIRKHLSSTEKAEAQKSDKAGGVQQTVKVGRLYLVDLAGSERLKKSKSVGLRANEARSINLSLTTLGMCISARASDHAHVPFRDSKLTRLLQESLGGNAKTTLLLCVANAHEHVDETLQSLQFGRRAMCVKNKPMVNERTDYRSLHSQLLSQLDLRQDTSYVLEAELNKTEEERDTLQAELEAEKSRFSDILRALKEESDAEVHEAQRAYKAQSTGLEITKQKVAELEQCINAQKAEKESLIAAYSVEVDGLVAQAMQRDAELESKNAAIESMTRQCASLIAQLANEMTGHMNSLAVQADEDRALKAKMEEAAAAQKQQVHAMAVTMEEQAAAQLQRVSDLAATMAAQAAELQQQLECAVQENDALRVELADEMEANQEQVAVLVGVAEALRVEVLTEVTSKQQQLGALMASHQQQVEALHVSQQQREDMLLVSQQELVEALQAENAAEVSSVQQQQQVQQQVEALKAELGLEAQLHQQQVAALRTELTAEVASHEEQVVALHAETAAELGSHKEQLVALRAELDAELSSHGEQVAALRDDKETEVTFVQQQLDALVQEADAMKAQLAEEQANSSLQHLQCQALQQQLAMAASSQQELEEAVLKLHDALLQLSVSSDTTQDNAVVSEPSFLNFMESPGCYSVCKVQVVGASARKDDTPQEAVLMPQSDAVGEALAIRDSENTTGAVSELPSVAVSNDTPPSEQPFHSPTKQQLDNSSVPSVLLSHLFSPSAYQLSPSPSMMSSTPQQPERSPTARSSSAEQAQADSALATSVVAACGQQQEGDQPDSCNQHGSDQHGSPTRSVGTLDTWPGHVRGAASVGGCDPNDIKTLSNGGGVYVEANENVSWQHSSPYPYTTDGGVPGHSDDQFAIKQHSNPAFSNSNSPLGSSTGLSRGNQAQEASGRGDGSHDGISRRPVTSSERSFHMQQYPHDHEALMEALRRMAHAAVELAVQQSDLRQAVAVLSLQYEHSTTEVEEKETDIAALSLSIEQLGVQLSESNMAHADLDAKLSETNIQLSGCRSLLEERDAELASCQHQLADLETELAEQHAHVAKLDADLASGGLQLTAWDSNLAECRSQLAQQEEELGACHAQLTLQDSELSNRRSVMAQQEVDLLSSSSHIARLDAELEGRQAAVDSLDAHIKLLKEEVDEERCVIRRQEGTIRLLSAAGEELELQLEEESVARESAEVKLRRTRSNWLSSFEGRCTAGRSFRAALIIQRAFHRFKATALEREVEVLHDLVATLQADAVRRTEAYTELERNMATSQCATQAQAATARKVAQQTGAQLGAGMVLHSMSVMRDGVESIMTAFVASKKELEYRRSLQRRVGEASPLIEQARKQQGATQHALWNAGPPNSAGNRGALPPPSPPASRLGPMATSSRFLRSAVPFPLPPVNRVEEVAAAAKVAASREPSVGVPPVTPTQWRTSAKSSLGSVQ